MRKNTLGKGLEALMGSESESALARGYMTLPTSRLKPGAGQPRKNFNDKSLGELADSIREKGMIQPLIVRKLGREYEIVAGERRWRAAQKAGLHEVPVIVREMADGESVEIALIENIQREDLNPIEEALAYEKLTGDFGLTHEEVSGRVGKSRAAITNQLRLLKLSDSARGRSCFGGTVNGARARHTRLENRTPTRKLWFAPWSQAEYPCDRPRILSKKSTPRGAYSPAKISEPDIYLKRAENAIRDSLGTKVKIEGGRKKGRIIIKYSSAEELDRLSFEMGGKSPVFAGSAKETSE